MTYSVYADVYSVGCVGGHFSNGPQYIAFRKKYGTNFYLYGWIAKIGYGGNQISYNGFTKLPSHASVIYDTIPCTSSYTFIDSVTITNILHDTTYINTFVHPITGLDSLVFTKLHVQSYEAHLYDTVCTGTNFMFVDGSSSLLTHDTIKANVYGSFSGCDSTIFNHVHVKPNSSSYTWHVACSNQLPYQWHGQSLTSPGIYTFHTPSAAGCDSLVTLNFMVHNTSSSSDSITVCSNQLPYVWNGQSLTTSGTYTYQTTNAVGCDSLVTLNFTIHNTSSSSDSITVCSNQLPYVWNGQSLTSSGTYTYQTMNIFGCDSISNLNFIVNTVDTSISYTANVMTSNASYQWIQCNPWMILLGETDQTFTASNSGDYAVIVTQNSCVDTSSCYTFLSVGINTLISSSIFQVHPNPTTSRFYFSDADNKEKELFDSVGRLILFTRENEMDVSHLAKGVYYIRCDQHVKKVLKE